MKTIIEASGWLADLIVSNPVATCVVLWVVLALMGVKTAYVLCAIRNRR